MNKMTALMLAATLALPLSALATHDGGEGHACKRHGEHQGQADTNKDGSIDKAEAQAMHDRHFEEMDTDKDGKLSKEEAAACKHGHMHEK